jgi:hypothetical protein
MANKLATKIDSKGHWSCGYIDKEIITWISGWYTYIPNIVGDGFNVLNISYAPGGDLYDQYYTTIAGGSDAGDVTTTETYVCPTQAGAILWADVNPAGGGIGLNYNVDGLFPAHICRARKQNYEPFTYLTGDGYYHEMFLLFGYSSGTTTHTFYWAYNDQSTSLWAQVPNSDPSLPGVGELYNIWVPSSVNISQVKWSSGLVQDVDKLTTGDGGGVVSLDYIKTESLIDNVTYLDGSAPFTIIDITSLAGTNDVIQGFCNGIEANVYVGDPAFAAASDDVIVDTTSGGYPAITDVYWNGSSSLGDLVLNDIIRLYYITT